MRKEIRKIKKQNSRERDDEITLKFKALAANSERG